MEKFLGIDIGGTNVKFGVVNTQGEIEHKVKFPTADFVATGSFINAFCQALKDLLATYPTIKKVGIGVPGTISKDRKTTLELANIPQLNNVNLIEKVEASFPDITFFLDNDANAAAMGEYYFSKNQLPDSFLFLTLGTGVGSAAIIDKQIFKGGDGNGMEAGHIICGTGETVEYHVGKKGIVITAEQLLSDTDKKSKLRKHPVLTAKLIEAAAKDGDELALKVYKKVGKRVGECIVSCVRILDVKTIIIGGGVSETYPFMEKRVNKVIEKYLTPYYTSNIDIRLATLANEAGIIGAAALCFKNKGKI